MPLWVWIFAEPKDPQLNPIKIDFRTGDEKKASLVTHPNHNFRITALDSKKKRGFLHRKFREFDDQYLKPCLLKPEAIREQKRYNLQVSALDPSDNEEDGPDMLEDDILEIN